MLRCNGVCVQSNMFVVRVLNFSVFIIHSNFLSFCVAFASHLLMDH